ncbi:MULTISPECIES: nucleoside hydrolase [unclassified Leifsonia]|uniref:nucleoside hydrolase n=1 Tax=unclassified Leifsonia TaxID=2663824 RepID=UPI0006F4268F|nr:MULTISPECIES: nucleoside hydrolase [unclassified Leifsonia]KQX07982.1 nucleoside hydrolase [Leifsonia sp. Root1293]KRA12263.1 nucleoside hydrolase [Leifsonia sp. Root60]
MRTSVILDVDTGVDDALAILFAVAHPDIDVRGITCVAGNAGLDQVVANTLSILDAARAPDIPVAAGARRPLIEAARSATEVHGADGLGGVELPASVRQPHPDGAVALMRRLLLESAEPLTLVALAPQTNLALLLRTHPEVVPHIERIVFMGGSASIGNATSVAEFNVWHDPEAAAIVLDSGVPCYMYGLDVFNHVSVPFDTALALAARKDVGGRVVGELLGNRVKAAGDYSGLIGDAGAVCAIVDPGAVGTQIRPVRVELAGHSRGQTVVDRREASGEDLLHGLAAATVHVEVALSVDADRMIRLFLATVAP